MRPGLITVFLLVGATPLMGQSPRPVEHFAAEQLRQSVASADTSVAGLGRNAFGDQGGYSYIFLRRDQSGEAEVHQLWDDVMVVQDGAATLLYGGALSGQRETGPGEMRGGQIAGGRSRSISAGDVVVVPAGIPHQVLVAPQGSVTYLVLKAQAQPAMNDQ